MSPSVRQPHTQFPDSFKFSKFEMDVVPWFSVAAAAALRCEGAPAVG